MIVILGYPQALLLVARSVDSNADCTRLVVDGWLELSLRDADAALRSISSALTLRSDWERLLQAQLRNSQSNPAPGHAHAADSAPALSRKELAKLSEGLVRFLLYTEVLKYTHTYSHTHTHIGTLTHSLSQTHMRSQTRTHPHPHTH